MEKTRMVEVRSSFLNIFIVKFLFYCYHFHLSACERSSIHPSFEEKDLCLENEPAVDSLLTQKGPGQSFSM